ncbi:MAG TPA: transcriptional regulator [Bacillus sp. (in: firmicutes)]|nr:transcriptional regulator [Bacillus sp. (in: firmicutes)]
MKVSKIVSNPEFQHMDSSKPYTKNEGQKKTVKNMLLARVKGAYGDTYYNLKQGTRSAIDMMCWFAAERGYVYAGDDYLGERYDIADRTVRRVAKMLRDVGLIVTVYRKAKNNNGRGCPMHLFVDHPYFERWISFLQIDFRPNVQTDVQTENEEIPCESKDESTKKFPTYDLTLNTFIKHNKRKEDVLLNSDFVPSYVPERFILAVQPFFKDAKEIYRLWGKVRLAHKISRLDTPVEELLALVIQTFKGSVFAYKQNKVKKAFTGYFFGGLRNVFAAAKRREAFQHQSNHPLFYNFLEA